MSALTNFICNRIEKIKSHEITDCRLNNIIRC